MTTKKDYYEILGVDKNSDESTIKKSFRKLANNYHPDKNIDIPEKVQKEYEEKFKDIKEAYEILSDPAKKSKYDQFGHNVNTDQYSSGFGANIDMSGIFGDIFNVFRTGGNHRNTTKQNVIYNLNITLEESAFGTSKSITIPTFENCQECSGTGNKDKIKSNCTNCNGTGTAHFINGPIVIQQICNRCRGTGKIITKPCDKCEGIGKFKTQKNISIQVPLGVVSDSMIQTSYIFDNNGEECNFLVKIIILKHDKFTRNNLDIEFNLDVDLYTAILGGTIEVPIISGTVNLTIPAGIQNSQLLRIKNKGISANNQIGDQICKIHIEIPKNLSAKQKELILEIKNLTES